jgi:hypothetical protein
MQKPKKKTVRKRPKKQSQKKMLLRPKKERKKSSHTAPRAFKTHKRNPAIKHRAFT